MSKRIGFLMRYFISNIMFGRLDYFDNNFRYHIIQKIIVRICHTSLSYTFIIYMLDIYI